jgi:hypothetical protein
MREVPISFETVVENVSAVRLSGCSMALRPSTRVLPVGISRLVLCRALCCTASLATFSAILVKHEHRRPHWRVAGSRGARLHGPAAAGLGLSMSCGSGSLSYLLCRPSYGYFTAVLCLLSCGTGDGPMPCQLYTSQGPRSSHQREQHCTSLFTTKCPAVLYCTVLPVMDLCHGNFKHQNLSCQLQTSQSAHTSQVRTLIRTTLYRIPQLLTVLMYCPDVLHCTAGDGPLPCQLHASQGAGGSYQREGHRHQATHTTHACR